MGGGRRVHDGWLTKSPPANEQGQKAVYKSWKKRFFVLLESKIVEYYEKPTSKEAKGSINLEDCTALRTNYPGHPHRFSLVTDKRVYFLDAENQEQLEQWTHALTILGGFVLTEASPDEDDAPAEASVDAPKPKGFLQRRLSRKASKINRSSHGTSTLRRVSTSSSSIVEPDMSGLVLASAEDGSPNDDGVSQRCASASTSSDEAWRRDSNASAASSSDSGGFRYGTPLEGPRRSQSCESEPTVAEEEENVDYPSNVPLCEEAVSGEAAAAATAAQGAVSDCATGEQSEGACRSAACRNAYMAVPSNIPLALHRQGRLLLAEGSESTPEPGEQAQWSVSGRRSVGQLSDGSTGTDCHASSSPSQSRSGRSTRCSNDDRHSVSTPPSIDRKAADSGVSGFSGSGSATFNSYSSMPSSSPIKISPELQRALEASTDEGIALGGVDADDSGAYAAGLPTGNNMTIPNPRLLSTSLPIPIPSSEGRTHQALTPIKQRMSGSLPGDGSPACAARHSAQESAPQADAPAPAPAPPLPTKPQSHGPAPGQPLQTQGYATLTAGDLKIDRSTKPSRPTSDPDAPSIDRNSKPKAPIHSTLPAATASPLFVPTGAPGSQVFVNSSPVFDAYGRPLVLQPGQEMFVRQASVGVQQAPVSPAQAVSHYSFLPAAIPARVGSVDSPYSIPPPRRNVSVDSASGRMFVSGEQALPRRSVDSTSSYSATGYEQVPTNITLLRTTSQHSGSFHPHLAAPASVRGSVGSHSSRVSLTSMHSSMSRASVGEVNDGGDYVMTPVNGPAADAPVISEQDQEYETMHPEGSLHARS